jgi:hypothetical protein
MRIRSRLIALLLATAGTAAAGGAFAAAPAGAAAGAFVYTPKAASGAGATAAAKQKTITDPKAGECIQTPGAIKARNGTLSAVNLYSDANCHTVTVSLKPTGTHRGPFEAIKAVK